MMQSQPYLLITSRGKVSKGKILALKNFVLDKKVLEDLSYLTKFCHTGVLETYYSLYNKWSPKRRHFFVPFIVS